MDSSHHHPYSAPKMLAFFKACKSPGNSDVMGCKEAARHRQKLCDYCYLCKTTSLSTSSKWNMLYLPSTGFLFDQILTFSLQTVLTKSTSKQSLKMTAPAPHKPLLVCRTGMYLGSFANPLYGELKHIFNRIDSRANCTHSARAKVCKLRVQMHFHSQD